MIENIYGAVLRFAERHTAAGNFLRGFKNACLLIRYRADTLFCRADEKTVVFCSYEGKSYSDSPKAMFEYMMECGAFSGWKFIWGLRQEEAESARELAQYVSQLKNAGQKANPADAPQSLRAPDGRPAGEAQAVAGKAVAGSGAQAAGGTQTGGAGAGRSAQAAGGTQTGGAGAGRGEQAAGRRQAAGGFPAVKIAGYDSKEWRRALASSKYWIVNFKVKDYVKPGKDQVFVQTWHGTPLKRLGYDLEHSDNPMNTSAGTARHYGTEVKKFTYFISPSPYATEKFKSAWRMEEHGKGDVIIETGYPRNDVLARAAREEHKSQKEQKAQEDHDRSARAALADRKAPAEKKFPGIAGKRVILYAPTYRQNQHDAVRGYTCELPFDPAVLRSALGEKFVILFRAHYFITNQIDFKKYEGFLYDVSNVPDVNDLYLISDILVTDYSSSMFDFSVLGRPMIFYMYDLEYYRDVSNGFYFDPYEELPGPIVKTQDELIRAILQFDEQKYAGRSRRFREKFNPLDDGHAAERAVRQIFF